MTVPRNLQAEARSQRTPMPLAGLSLGLELGAWLLLETAGPPTFPARLPDLASILRVLRHERTCRACMTGCSQTS